jgi:HSP20 family molecular chaperone IbpA
MLLNLLKDYGVTPFRETPSNYTMRICLPGVGKDNIKIKVQDSSLLVTIYETTLSYPIPTHVNLEKIKAKYEDGILRVSIEKDESKIKEIKID